VKGDLKIPSARFDNGTIATAQASSNAVYGDDIRKRSSARPGW
jgi:hypothetical protein